LSILERLAGRSSAKDAGRRLYAAAVAEARSPAIYADLGAPDTPDGRFEVYTLHVLLLVERLRGHGATAGAVSQATFDAYLDGLDHGLREMAVGDVSVGKAMRKLGEAFYGRGKSWEEAIAALPDRAPLEALLRRTVFGGSGNADPCRLAAYLLDARDRLAQTPLDRLLQGDVGA